MTAHDCWPAEWFPHDAGASAQLQIAALIEQMGPEGPGIYWILLETLRRQPEHRYPMALIPRIARESNTTTTKIELVVRQYGLFVVDDENMFFPSP